MLKIYLYQRLESQQAFYESRVRENRQNTDFTYNLPAFSIMVSSVILGISLFSNKLQFLVIAIILPSLASSLMAFRQLYGWERQTDIYKNALSDLENVKLLAGSLINTAPEDLAKYYPQLVLESENAFATEVSQWGSIQSGGVINEKSENVITVEPMFGLPPTQQQFKCDVFMIMPFTIESLQLVYSKHIKPMMEELNIEIKRGDDFFSKHMIMSEIWASIYHSQIVICECTERNANVFYELGIAHTLGKPAIMLTQSIDTIPFDLRHLRIITYENTPEGMQALCTQLKDALSRLLPLETLLKSKPQMQEIRVAIMPES